MDKKKYKRDKDQVRNLYYNTYKMGKEKANIAEDEWEHVPSAAKEAILVVNVLEWKKRCHNAPLQHHRFKELVLTGVSTGKQQGKRLPVTVKTPVCKVLQKFFPCRSRSATKLVQPCDSWQRCPRA